MKGGVYVIRVEGVGNYYGESSDIPSRWTTHRRLLHRGRHTNYRLKAAWKALGPAAFTFEVLDQSPELTKNKPLRQLLEKRYILEDPTALNVREGHDVPVTQASLPYRPIYQNRIVRIVRQKRSSIVKIYSDEGTILGTESVSGKFRLGKFFSDANCRLTRVK